ncbi:MAG TPA: M12 family metallopeptidase, partial [Verrucomicrobiae bacterium]|nr:M12 family metallopeptidase [Verrucomicrobiae bacterium]
MNTASSFFPARKFGCILAFVLAIAWPLAGFGSNYYQGVATNSVPWPGGIVPYKFDTNVTPAEQTIYLEGMKEWELAANIHFVPYTNQPDYVLLRFDYTQGTDTFVATIPGVMTVDTLSRAQVCHETGHLLGFQHEHVRIDRNTYITVNFTNMIGSDSGGTNASGEGASVSNLYVIDTNSTSFGAYDFESVMHYSRTLFSTNPDIADTIDANAPYYAQYYYRIGNYALSPGDRAGAAHLYGLPTTALTNVVTNTADGGFGSLRAALYYANDHPGTTIRFNISANDPGYSNGVYTIYLSGELPPLIANGTVIDATTQPGYSSHPVIAISGAQLSPELAYPNTLFNCGLRIYAANCIIDGLSIQSFPFLGIAVEYAYAVSNRIEGCYIGVAPNSTNAAGNAYQGISIDTGATHTIVGGTIASQGNVISGNAQYAILVIGTNGQPAATHIGTNTVGTIIQGNYIGTDPTGTYAVSNVVGGIWEFNGASGMMVGGTNSPANNVSSGNLISGNGSAGILLDDVSNNVVQGNNIGLNGTGNGAIPNADSGVYVVAGSTSNLIGGAVRQARNVISGNVKYGVFVSDPGTANLVVQGNYIGTDPSGTTAIGNGLSGIGIWSGALNILVGGTNARTPNLISGNGAGISVGGAGTGGVQIYGNYVGVTSNGVAALPNTGDGIYLEQGVESSAVGGALAGLGNLVSGNGGNGVHFYGSGTSGNTVEGNYIGVASNGVTALPNAG